MLFVKLKRNYISNPDLIALKSLPMLKGSSGIDL